MRSLSVALAFVAAIALSAGVGARAAGPVAPGQPAPGVSLPSASGQAVSLASLKGSVVLVDFWASWCGPCASAFPNIENLFQDYHPRGFEVLAINLDEQRDAADRFLADRPHAMTVLFDPKGTSARAFGLAGMPSSYLIGRDGRVRFVHTGYSSGTLESYRREIEQLLRE